MKQNKFKSVGVLILIITTLFSVVACKNIPENKVETKTPFFKISIVLLIVFMNRSFSELFIC